MTITSISPAPPDADTAASCSDADRFGRPVAALPSASASGAAAGPAGPRPSRLPDRWEQL
jgi:hypothetical protein